MQEEIEYLGRVDEYLNYFDFCKAGGWVVGAVASLYIGHSPPPLLPLVLPSHRLTVAPCTISHVIVTLVIVCSVNVTTRTIT